MHLHFCSNEDPGLSLTLDTAKTYLHPEKNTRTLFFLVHIGNFDINSSSKDHSFSFDQGPSYFNTFNIFTFIQCLTSIPEA